MQFKNVLQNQIYGNDYSYSIPDDVDNCPQHCNVDQLDADGDGIGDGCDLFILRKGKTQISRKKGV